MKYFKPSFLFLLGIGIGVVLYIIISVAPIKINSPVLKYLGIKKPMVMGFLPYFLAYRATNNYNPYITTLTYFAFTIDNNGHVVKLTTPQQEDPGWHDLETADIQKQLTNAKNNGKVLSLSIVGQSEDSIAGFLQNPKQSAQNVLADVIPVMKQFGFEDINVDIESFKTVDKSTQNSFTTFIKTLADSVHRQSLGTVGVDIAPIAFIHTTIVDPVALGKVADYVMVMAYDYHTVVSSNTGGVAPLNGIGVNTEYDVTTAINIAKKEIDPSKIIFGTPLYGYEWDTLSSTPGAATIPNTGQTASNRRIIDTFTGCATCTIATDMLAVEHQYVYQDQPGDLYYHQIYLFSTQDLQKRLDFVTKNKLGGVGLWALGYEGQTLLQGLDNYKQSFARW